MRCELLSHFPRSARAAGARGLERSTACDGGLAADGRCWRLVVSLRYFGDLSHAETAAIRGVTEGTVAATPAQARSELTVPRKEVV